ncbi:MAG: FmdB family transcriptional regulator [Legionellaceae bacterium]|nr:FmdB family transcriptional regulator [Legionellaceae bacterium]
MPIYEYQCKACGEHIEKFQKSGAEPLLECPKCGKLELSKLISAAGFKLTGSGWYETDFKNKPKTEVKPTADASSEASKTPSTQDKSDDKAK